MDTTDLLSMLPPEWLAMIEAYAPSILTYLVIGTVLVHMLVPVARAVERWAIGTSVTWDDGPAKKLVEVLEWLAAASADILAYLPRLAVGGMNRSKRPGSAP